MLVQGDERLGWRALGDKAALPGVSSAMTSFPGNDPGALRFTGTPLRLRTLHPCGPRGTMKRAFMNAFATSLALLAVATLSGCGPSYRMLREGDSRFEHCYALDERTDVDSQERAQCWERFAAAKYPGQGVDRTQYATGRMQALRALSSSSADPKGGTLATSTSALSVHAQAPANAFAPPPNIVRLGDAGRAQGESQAQGAAPGMCRGGCYDAWSQCRRRACQRTEADSASGCEECDRVYGACAKGCAGPDAKGAHSGG